MTDESDRNLERTVGGLTKGFESLERQVHALLETWQRMDNGASEGRRLMHLKMDAVREEIVAVNLELKPLVVRVTKMEPDVADYKMMRANVRGGLLVLSFLGAAIFTAIGFVMKDWWAWLKTHVVVQ